MHPRSIRISEACSCFIFGPRGPLDRPEEIDGAALETLVLQNMRAVLDWEFPGTDI